MNDTALDFEFRKTYSLPYLLGVYLAVNAVSDICLVVDGFDCMMSKIDLVYGNHDLFSTLLSCAGRHRVIRTRISPVSSDRDPEQRLLHLLASISRSGEFGAALVTAPPSGRLGGVDYQGIAEAASSRIPVGCVPPLSLGNDWLSGYAETLDALARLLPPGKRGKRSRRSVALVGYMLDRNEFDHRANLGELERLLAAAGLTLVSVWPSGGSFAGLAKAGEAGLIVSLPYGRAAARTIAGRTGADLLETGLPLGLAGTVSWIGAVARAAGVRNTRKVLEEERAAAAVVAAALPAIAHKKPLFAGDPHLYSAFSAFALELGLRPSCAVLNSRSRPERPAARQQVLLFEPEPGRARAALEALPVYERPDFAVANSFAVTEGITCGLPFMELGFPSYGHHCLLDEPYLGFAGVRGLTGRILNCLRGLKG